MTTRCTICTSAAAERIDQDLRTGDSHQTVATRYNISKGSVSRHARKHLTKVAGSPLASPATGGGNLGDIQTRKARLDEIANRAEQSGAHHNAIAAMREWRALDEHEKRLSQSAQDSQWLYKTEAFGIFLGHLLKIICPKCRDALGEADPPSMEAVTETPGAAT